MIFVATGTTGFDALVGRMDQLAPTLAEELIIQIGDGEYVPRHAESFRFAPSLEPYYERASLVVAHGGVGITLEVLNHNRPLVSLSNPDRYDQHQKDLLGALAADGYLLWCLDLNELPDAIQEAKEFTFRRYEKAKCEIHVQINGFLDNLRASAS